MNRHELTANLTLAIHNLEDADWLASVYEADDYARIYADVRDSIKGLEDYLVSLERNVNNAIALRRYARTIARAAS